ncbi:NAD-dependent epimerase/dehydratase family protein [Pseudonocardia sp. KRD-184]|uniref:NAD-dependent epimerase/dehydratase family protein n=1 Tax=Pseudonocardia oceani TaxID=2792013 RepID=A0ABS6UAU6_9PSEU|nr:NAD-dependent epimerase/dehydratase family protein [Pseudonocardia oceani]MBW0089570.1 NAD-dependent epimerase/dehydratase family protein [Pseudonocardia oceani]MBW0096635.1 NAD-dependent epimerase/dehydratase family protein [Pseudonocardia oceani]MBW0109326.1 NAD-dependent epimerase/dehydratase family protein [Pseudonocardia oceani]MBW0123491.1 NAD-dependent epimerase/dehydratase family protein [Pseudonocardia oceani]MBW0129366.1 NAD-dependent epimerase/dehydratase family protein [Pseudono
MMLVTGATGYLGSALVELAVRRGLAVRAAVRDADRARALLPAGVEVAVADLGDVDALTRAARGCTGVLHLAGSVGHSAEETRRANVDGTRAVLSAATAAGVPRFVYTSSSAAIMDADGLLAEEPVGPPALTDAYSLSKAEAERVVLAAPGIEAMVVNPVSVFGPSPLGPHSYNGLFLAAARGEVPAVVDATVGWVLAEDAALGHLLALEHGEPGRRYLLCGGTARFGHVLHAFAAHVGGARVRVLPPGSALGEDAGTFARRSEVYGHFPPVHVDDRGARALGFAPRGVDEGLALTAAWTGTLTGTP